MSILDVYGDTSLTTFSHARHALVEALRRGATPRAATVLLPGFICRDVLAAIHAVGATPEFYEVDRTLRPMDLERHRPAHAILAVDYFGIAQDMAPYLRMKERHGTIVIEDNAHGLLGRDPDGRLLGTRGDFGLLSMRKTFHLPDGAALLDNRPGAPAGGRDCSPNGGGTLRRRVVAVQRATGLPLMDAARFVVRAQRRARGLDAIPRGCPEDEQVLPGIPIISCSTLDFLERTDTRREIARRTALSIEVARTIEELGEVESMAHLFRPGAVAYGVPFRATAAGAALTARRLRRYHVTVMPWPDLPTAIVGSAPAHYRDCWIANFI